MARIPDDLRAACAACVAGEAPWPLFAYGAPGVGKTHAAFALFARAAGPARFAVEADLAEQAVLLARGELRDGADAPVGRVSWRRDLAGAAFVALDEVGTVAVAGGGAPKTLYEALLTLLDARAGKPTMLCSNLSTAEIGRAYDARIVSRLQAGTIVRVNGPDQRRA